MFFSTFYWVDLRAFKLNLQKKYSIWTHNLRVLGLWPLLLGLIDIILIYQRPCRWFGFLVWIYVSIRLEWEQTRSFLQQLNRKPLGIHFLVLITWHPKCSWLVATQICFLFSPQKWGRFPILTLSNGLAQPPRIGSCSDKDIETTRGRHTVEINSPNFRDHSYRCVETSTFPC